MTRFLTAADILSLKLPGVPSDKGALSRFIGRHGWRISPLARQGERGWEYAAELLPAAAQTALTANAAPIESPQRIAPQWEAFERLSAKSKAEAHQRLQVVQEVERLLSGGLKVGAAVSTAARQAGIGSSTLWHWLKLCEGVPRADKLSALAPTHRGRTVTADCDPRAWDFLVADYLRAERPSFEAAHRRMREAAAAHFWSPLPSARTLQRRLEKLPAAVRLLARHGGDPAARMFPNQIRDRSSFAALQAVNADGHRFDVFVRWEDGSVGRPLACVVQDLSTGLILGHRIAQSENWATVRLAFADVVRRYGIPEQCWVDNGRAFASKWLTGGMQKRFRFTVRDDEPAGILTQLGIRVHWTTPYHGQSKPIERAFRDFCEEIAKHPACAGAYTGNRPDAKPKNYGSKAIPIATFRALVAAEIERHNNRTGRRTAVAAGGSFAEAFSRSLAAPGTIITRATPAQQRMLLMAAEGITARKPTGEIHLGGNRYWAEPLAELAGRQVVVRFDPDDLRQLVGVYTRDGRLVCEAPCIEAVGFADAEAAGAHARRKRQWLKGQREQLKLEQRLGIAEVAELLPKVAPTQKAEPGVVRLARRAPTSSHASESFSRAVRSLADDTDSILPFSKVGTG